MSKRMRLSDRVVLGLFVLVLFLYPFVITNRYWMNLMITVFMFVALGQAWNWVGGYAGQISFGHAAFFGIGAYTSTLLLVKWGVNPWLGMIVGAILAGAMAAIIGYPIFRLQGHYFAIATIALGEILRIAFDNWDAVGGAAGIELPIMESSLLHFQFFSKVPYYFIALGMVVIAYAVTYWIETSRVGYYLRAIREDQDAARALGVSLNTYKSIALVLSAMMTAMVGTFYAQYILFIDPASTMSLDLSILISLVPVLGGAGTFWGPLVGGFVLIPISELSRSFLGGGGRAYNLILYGALIIVVAVVEPGGLWELVRRWGRRPPSRPASKEESHATA